MLRRRLLATLLTTTALAATAAGCGTSDDTPDTSGSSSAAADQVRVGVIPTVDVAPIYLGKEQGFFARRHIDLTMEQVQAGAAVVPAVVSGQYQFGFSDVASLMLAQSRDVPIKAVANGDNASGDPRKDFGMLVVKDPAIKTVKDLDGKTVATNGLRNIVDTSVKELVRRAAGNPATVKFVEVPFPDMAAALDAGRVQAAFLVEPFLASALAENWRTIGSFADIDPRLSVSAYFTSTQLIQTKADLVARFAEAMKESLAYADTHPDAVQRIVATYTTIKADAAVQMTLPKFPTEIDKGSVEIIDQLLVAQGLLTKPADLTSLFP